LQEVKLKKVEPVDASGGSCAGLTFVITGDVHYFKNRNAFKAYVESQGGKVAGSVSGKTDFLVNNDVESASSKNRKAKELGVPILSEDDFTARFIR
jgi:DNA ligase (NAD+)